MVSPADGFMRSYELGAAGGAITSAALGTVAIESVALATVAAAFDWAPGNASSVTAAGSVIGKG